MKEVRDCFMLAIKLHNINIIATFNSYSKCKS